MSRYKENATKNEKRKVRRTLPQRLAMAQADAVGGESPRREYEDQRPRREPEEHRPRREQEEQRQSTKEERCGTKGQEYPGGNVPSRAPHLRSRSSERDPDARGSGEGRRSTPRLPAHLGMREGVHGKKRDGRDGGEQRDGEEDQEPHFKRHKYMDDEPCSRRMPSSRPSRPRSPPWGPRGSKQRRWEGACAVRPRWQVEQDLDEEAWRRAQEEEDERNHAKRSLYKDTLLSKAATQLLRWGRADIVERRGGIRHVHLPGWTEGNGLFGSWHDLGVLSRLLDAEEEVLREVLVSVGKHGPRCEIEGFAARCVWGRERR